MLWLLWKVYHNWVVYHKIQIHSFLKIESLGETRCRKSWHQFKGVRFTKSTQRHASIWEKKGPPLGKINVKVLHQRRSCAMKFEDMSHEETERQQRCARSKAWNLAKKTSTSSKKMTRLHSTFPRRNGYSRLRQQKIQRKEFFVVDSGASMHMVSTKDLSSAELETMRTSRSPMMVMTANGEVQTKEEATVYVKQVDLFV